MRLSIVLRRAAQSEFDEAADWYEQQRRGLGRDFVKQVQAVFSRIIKELRLLFAFTFNTSTEFGVSELSRLVAFPTGDHNDVGGFQCNSLLKKKSLSRMVV